ncbi:Ral GTPase-activating protein subunit alpha-2 [Mortierella sp. AD031]|nr:Ral GTPase-activating protein subunit alpha-2 [Mortierella sp. AD031]
MDPDGLSSQHPFDDFDHVRPLRPSQDLDLLSPVLDSTGPDSIVSNPSSRPQSQSQVVNSPTTYLPSSESFNTISTVLTTHSTTSSHSSHTATNLSSSTISTIPATVSHINTTNTTTTANHSNGSHSSHYNTYSNYSNNSQSNPNYSHLNTHSHSTLTYPNHNNAHPTHYPLGPPMPPTHAPSFSSSSSLATTAAARFSQAFSPLLSSRRKSTAVDLPSTPDGHKTFPYSITGSTYASPGSPYAPAEGQHSASQERLSYAGYSGGSGSYHQSSFESNFSKIASFSSPRSSARTRKTLPAHISHVPEESGYGSFETPPHTATAFHTGLASHFGAGSTSSQARDHHEGGHHKELTGKGSIIGGSSIDKALKKARVFMDEKAKPKARAASLWTFLDGTFEFDQAKFFQEHADQVFAVTHDSFWHQIDKFKQKPDRNNALQSKEVLAIQKTLLLLRLIFLYLPDRMKNGWHRRPIANMLAQVLCHKNHPRIRIFGFRLLLLWINDQTVEYPEAIYLFSNAISLDLFMYDGEDLSVDHASSSQTRLPPMSNGSTGRRGTKHISQYLDLVHVNLNQELLLSDGPPICPNPSPPTFQDSIRLFQIFLANIVRMAYVAAGSTPPAGELESINSHHPIEADGEIGDGIAVGFGIDAGMAAARFMFDIIKKYYLIKVFPECARNLHLLREEGKEFGYKTCPPTILRTIISFVIQYCLDSNEINSPQTHTSPATPILKSIVYSSEVNREIMHEIVRQGLSLPPGHPQYKDIVRGAVHIVGVWCLSGEEERPVFLRSSSSRTHGPSSSSLASLGDQPGSQQGAQSEPYSFANSFLQRYFQLLTNVFAENNLALHDHGSNSSSEALGFAGNQAKLDMEAIYHQYKNILGLFRAIMARGQIEMDTKSWEVLLGCLLLILRRVMNLQDRVTSPMPASFADDLASNVVETVLCAYSRCPSVSDSQWLALRKTMVDSLRWPQVIAQWIRWSVRLTHVLAHEVFQVDLDAPVSRPTQTSTSRHGRKMSEKFRHSRFITSKTESPMRHSIGGELLSSQGIAYAHQTYPLAGERSSRRANSVHYDPAKQGGPHSTQTGANYNPSPLGHIGFLPGRESAREHHSNLRADVGEVDEDEPFDHNGSYISALAEAAEGNDEKLSRASSLSFHGPDSLHLDPIVERLSSQYGIFASSEFVNISMKGRSAENILSVWKNIVCSIGNPNAIQIPLVKTEVMLCLIDVWDLLNQIRSCQPLSATVIPPLYDFAPWFFEAAKSTSDGGVGLPAIYGGLCRMMSRRFDQDFDPEYYQLFYDSVIQGLLIDDSMIGHSILANSSRLFTLSLPGSHILVLPFLNAIRQMLLKDGHLRDGVNHFIRKQAIAILCSVSMLFYDFEHRLNDRAASGVSDRHPLSGGDLLSYKLTFTRLVLDLTSAEAYVKPLGKFWDTHSMLIQLCGMLVVNEWSSSLATCDIGTESELLLLVLDHLYWTEASIVQSAVEVVTTLAGMYKDHEDNGWIVLEMVLSHLLSAMQEHLRLFQSDTRRGTLIASFYRCLVEWLMVIPASIFSETELSKWVFELIEIGLLLGPDSTGENEKKRALQAAKQQQQQQQQAQQAQQQHYQYLRTGRKRGPSFRHTGKAIHQHHRVMISTGPVVDIEIEQQTIKESAEATLVHLVHFFNNAPACRGSDRALVTLGMDPANDGASGSKTGGGSKITGADEHQRIFALNDSILITIEEVPCARQGTYRTRVVLRDETGRYAWDSEIFYREMLQMEDPRPRSVQRTGSRVSERFGSTSSRRRKAEMASQLIWREGVHIREDENYQEPRVATPPAVSTPAGTPAGTASLTPPAQGIESLLWDGSGPKVDGDRLDQLLSYVGQQHPDCLFDGKTPLNQLNNGMALSTEPRTFAQIGGNGLGHNGLSRRTTIDFELDRHVQEESYYTRISDPQARAWYDKLVELRSSLIQEDDDVDEYHGSNTLMSLVVNANWNGSEDTDGPIPKGFEKDADHTALYERAKQTSNRRIRHDNLQEIHAEAIRSENLDLDRDGRGSSPINSRRSFQSDMVAGVEASQSKEDAFSMAKAFQLALPPEAERPLDSFQHSRLLLSHLGLLCFDRFQEHNFVLLNPSASLERDLKSLDKKSGRETFKIAVIYVAAGQEGEQAILLNSKGSAAYNRFVQDLGWEVELEHHSGYIGGLEKNGSSGRTAMYYSSSTLEVLFHEVVRLPTDPDDPRQVKKKRHVGNDHVHIVWSEHSRAYDRNTIGGDFGNVILVLSPVRELTVEDEGIVQNPYHHSGANLVSIEVIRDTNLPVFGPLVDGMVVPMSQLGRLVRQTAIHAARLATAPPPMPPTPPSAGFSASNTTGNIISIGSGLGVGGGGLTGTGGMHHRASMYHTHTNSGIGAINSAMQGHQYHQSNLVPTAINNSGVTGSGSTIGSALLGGGNGTGGASGTGAGSGLGSAGGIMATLTSTATATSTALLGPNVGSGPNGASASSLVSNSGSTHGSNGSQSGSGGSGAGMNGAHTNGGGGAATVSMVTAANGIGVGAVLTNNASMQLQGSQHQQQQQQQQGVQVVSQSPAVPAVTTTSSPLAGSSAAVSSFSTATMHHAAHSVHPFKQRAISIEQIARRHKVEKWTFQQFMEQVFGYSTHLHPHPSRNH